MNQREDVQDQLDILATNLEIVNQKISSIQGRKVSTAAGSIDTSHLEEEVKKIQQWIKSLVDHMILLKTSSDDIIKEQKSMDSKLTPLSPLPNYAKETYSQVKILSTLPEIQHSLTSSLQKIDTIHQKLQPLEEISSMKSTLSSIHSQNSTLTTLSTQLQTLSDALENQRKITVDTQSKILYLEKLQKHTYERLHQEIQQLPYRPVDEETKSKMLTFPEDEQTSMLKSISHEMKLSRKQFPALFAFVITIMTIFGLALFGLMIYIIMSL